MRYELTQAQNWADTETKNELSKLGFVFRREKNKSYAKQCGDWYWESSIVPTIEIDTLEELMEFINKYGRIVLDNDRITIYNGYIE